MMETKDRTDKYIKAKKQVENIKAFYKHAAFFALMYLSVLSLVSIIS